MTHSPSPMSESHDRSISRRTLLLSGGAIAASAMAACSPSSAKPSGNGGSTLTWATESEGPALDAEKQVIHSFEEKHSNVRVNVQQIPFTAYDTTLLTALKSKQGPDVFRVNHPNIGAWGSGGLLAPLEQSGVNEDGLLPSLVKMGNMSGKQYTYPMDTDCRVLFYNPSLLAKHGVHGAPSTWDELVSAVARFKGTGIYGYGFVTAGDYATAYATVGPYVKAAGAEFLTSQGGTMKAAAAAQPGVVDSMELLQRIVATGTTPPGESNMTNDVIAQLFAKDKLAFFIQTPASLTSIKQDRPSAKEGRDYASAVIPVQHAGDKSASVLGGYEIGVSAYTKNRSAAFALASYIEQPENLRKIAAAGGTLPAVVDAFKNSPFGSDPFYDSFKELLPRSSLVVPPIAQFSQVCAAMNTTLLPAILNGKSSTSALDAFDDQVNGQIL